MACVHVFEGVSMPDSKRPLDSQCDKATPYKPRGVSSLGFAVLAFAPFLLLIFCGEECKWEWPNSEGAATWQLPGVVAADQLCSQLEAKLLHSLQLR